MFLQDQKSQISQLLVHRDYVLKKREKKKQTKLTNTQVQ